MKNQEKEIKQQVIKLAKLTKKLNGHEQDCKNLTKQMEQFNVSMSEIEAKISSMPTEMIDIAKVRNKIFTKKSHLTELNDHIRELEFEKEQKNSKYEALCSFAETFPIEELKEKKQKLDDILSSIAELKNELSAKQKECKNYASKVELLHDHEYDPDCKYCSENKFVKDAELAKKKIPAVEAEIAHLQQSISVCEKDYQTLDPDKVEDHLKKYQQVLDKKVETSSRITEIGLEIERDESTIKLLTKELEELESEELQYEENKEAIENLEELIAGRKSIKSKIRVSKKECDSCTEENNNLFREIGSAEQNIENINKNKEDLEILRVEFAAYDLLMRCYHPNGISYNIIKNRLPLINEEAAKILTGVVDFEIFIKNEDKKLDIFIKHPKYEPRPLEMGSGAEKTIASMAIRLALLTVSSLPKPDIFILDEPGTALDEDNMEGFVRIIDMVKSYFRTVMLISHLDTLKDAVDTQIVIDRKKGFAHVNI